MKLLKTVLNESPKKLIVHFYLEGEQNDGEQVKLVILDPTQDLTPGQRNMLTIRQIWNAQSWFDVLLQFDDLQPVPSWVLTRDSQNYHDFRYFSGIKDRSGIEGSGQVLLSTSGFGPGSIGTFIIEFQKD